MKKQEIINDINDLKAAISATDDPEEKKMLEDGLKDLEKQLKELEEKEKNTLPKKKLVKEVKKPSEKVDPEKPKKESKKPAVKKKMLKKALKQPAPKKITIEKNEKKEAHTITTAFDKDIKDAILVLNKERYVIREQRDKKTGKVEKVKHSPEYRNAKLIETHVNTIFKSSIHDIAKTPQDRRDKKEIIAEIEAIRDLSTVFLSEVDLIINNENIEELQSIKKLMLRLVKESGKNDKDKYKFSGRLNNIMEKYKI